VHEPDDLDRAVLEDLREQCGDRLWGESPKGVWATSRAEALRRLDYAVAEVLPCFGPHEDAMVSNSWHLAHTLLSPYLNLGLVAPAEVCDAVELAYRAGDVPIASAEGLIRQIIGWRGYVWGVYWLWMPEYRNANALGAERALPPVFTTGRSEMRCVQYSTGCRFDRTKRVGPDACPFTTLYWSFLDTHRERFSHNPRTAQQVRGLDRLWDLDAVRGRSAEVLAALDAGLL
jgi:deoxyribodipyrimidine photolyase-like uncharacterized protein